VELVQLQKQAESFAESKVALAAVSSDAVEDLANMKKKTGIAFPLLRDENGRLMKEFGIVHDGGNPVDGSDIARPALILLGTDGTVLWSETAENYRVRPGAAGVARQVEQAFEHP